jgi:hypothetical protein
MTPKHTHVEQIMCIYFACNVCNNTEQRNLSYFSLIDSVHSFASWNKYQLTVNSRECEFNVYYKGRVRGSFSYSVYLK